MASIDRTVLLDLYQSLGPTLVLYARTWVDGATAHDVVQDVFVKLFTEGTRHDLTNARAWLYASVRHRAISLSRSSRRRAQREEKTALPALAAGAHALADAEVAAAALDSLEADDREVLVLRIWGGMTFEEMAALGLGSASTVFRRYQSALGTLRAAMEIRWTPHKT